MSKVDLRVDFCSHEAAKYAVEKWHYSRVMPAGKIVKIGAWEDDRFVGVTLFSRGASDAIGKPYGLDQTQVSELTRVALTQHTSRVSQIVAAAIKLLRSQSDGLRLLVSYADPYESHHGGIYQAMNWIYVGQTSDDFAIIDKTGKRWHSRMVSTTGYKKSFGVQKRVIRPDEGKRVDLPGKHKYLYPLDRAMRRQIEPLAKPYPKRADVGEIESRVGTTD